MSKKPIRTSAKVVGSAFNPISWVTLCMKYKPTGNTGLTKNILDGIDVQKMFSKKSYKELFDALKSVKSSHSFEKAMQIKGIDEKDLKTCHARDQFIMKMLLFIPLFPLYQIFNLIHKAGEMTNFGVIQTLTACILPMLLIVFLYLFFAWDALKIRNRMLFSPTQFFVICKNDLSNLSPIEEYELKVKDKKKTKKLVKKKKEKNKQ